MFTFPRERFLNGVKIMWESHPEVFTATVCACMTIPIVAYKASKSGERTLWRYHRANYVVYRAEDPLVKKILPAIRYDDKFPL